MPPKKGKHRAKGRGKHKSGSDSLEFASDTSMASSFTQNGKAERIMCHNSEAGTCRGWKHTFEDLGWMMSLPDTKLQAFLEDQADVKVPVLALRGILSQIVCLYCREGLEMALLEGVNAGTLTLELGKTPMVFEPRKSEHGRPKKYKKDHDLHVPLLPSASAGDEDRHNNDDAVGEMGLSFHVCGTYDHKKVKVLGNALNALSKCHIDSGRRTMASVKSAGGKDKQVVALRDTENEATCLLAEGEQGREMCNDGSSLWDACKDGGPEYLDSGLRGSTSKEKAIDEPELSNPCLQGNERYQYHPPLNSIHHEHMRW